MRPPKGVSLSADQGLDGLVPIKRRRKKASRRHKSQLQRQMNDLINAAKQAGKDNTTVFNAAKSIQAEAATSPDGEADHG